MATKLILTDIDGTIMQHGKRTVSSRTKAAFHAALDAGILVGPASGRGYAWIPEFFSGDTACCQTALATNGLQVYLGGEKVLERSLDPGALAKVHQIVTETPHAGLVCFDGATPLLVDGDRATLTRHFAGYGERCIETRTLPDFPVVKANVFVSTTEADAKELVDRLNTEVPELDVDRALPTYSNIMPRGWNKGTAVQWMCEHLGIMPDEVVVFGDADNDLTMFEAVPNSVAVSGATSAAAATARWHIGACEDDAVAAAIELLAQGIWPFKN